MTFILLLYMVWHPISARVSGGSENRDEPDIFLQKESVWDEPIPKELFKQMMKVGIIVSVIVATYKVYKNSNRSNYRKHRHIEKKIGFTLALIKGKAEGDPQS